MEAAPAAGAGAGAPDPNAKAEEAAALWTATTHGDEVKTERPHWRYTSTTSHPRFGSYRNASNDWAPTTGNGKDGRYCHEYVGRPATGAKRRNPIAEFTPRSGKLPRPAGSQLTMMQAFSRSLTQVSNSYVSTGSGGPREARRSCLGRETYFALLTSLPTQRRVSAVRRLPVPRARVAERTTPFTWARYN